MATYAQRYGAADPKGKGPYAPFLGDPSRWRGVPFPDDKNQWVVLNDEAGNPWLTLVSGENKARIYDWANVRNRNPQGYAQARPIFEDIERRYAAAVGISVGGTGYLAYPHEWTTVEQNQQPGAQFAGAATVAVEHSENVVWQLDASRPRSDMFGPQDTSRDGQRAEPRAGVSRIGVQELTLLLPLPSGGTTQIYASGNAALRIAFITGFPGEVIGGDALSTWILEAGAEIIRTLEDVALIVVAYYTGNVMLAIGAAEDIVSTWAAFAAAQDAANAAVQDEGKYIEGGGLAATVAASQKHNKAAVSSGGGGALVAVAVVVLLLVGGSDA